MSIRQLFKKINEKRRNKTLFSAVISRIKQYLPIMRSMKYCIYNPASGRISLHCPDYLTPDKGELVLVNRIFCAFKKMEKALDKAKRCYLPSSMWQNKIKESYSYLYDALREDDINKFHYFLTNFGSWKKDTWIESSAFIRKNIKSFPGRLYLQNDVFYRQLKIWQWFYGNKKPVSELSYPTYGNQAGAFIDGHFAGVGSFFNEIYGSLLSDIIRYKARPVVADLGAGYGKLAYFTTRNLKNFTFIDFDLPEVLCLAAYYLMKAYPDKKVLLFGETDYFPVLHDKYDLIFMPCWEIEKVGHETIDLFINKNSLGEMTRDAAVGYIRHITDSARYFFHMNHDMIRNTYENNESGLLGYEYPVPREKFTLLFRYPDMGHMLYKGFLDLETDIFIYLYERKDCKLYSQPEYATEMAGG